MFVGGNLRISNKFWLTTSPNVLSIQPNCPKHLHSTHCNHLNHNVRNQQQTISEDRCKSKVAIITGGIRGGVGFKVADYLLKQNAKAVILADEHLNDIQFPTYRLRQKHGEDSAYFKLINPSSKEDISKLFEKTKEKFGKIDYVINTVKIEADSQEKGDVKKNVVGLLQSTFLGFQEMFRNGGVIINSAAILEHEPLHSLPIFNETNNFLIGFTKNMSRNYFHGPSNVKIMAICPCSANYLFSSNYLDYLLKDLVDEGKSQEINDWIKKYPNKEKNSNNHPQQDEVNQDATNSFFAKYPCQNPDDVANAVLRMLKEGENGSIWIAEPGNLYKMNQSSTYPLKEEEDEEPCPLNIGAMIDPITEENNEIFLKKHKFVPADPFDYGCKKKPKPKKKKKKRNPMKPPYENMVAKKDPCEKFKKGKKKKK